MKPDAQPARKTATANKKAGYWQPQICGAR
jgi:hypothetical protein